MNRSELTRFIGITGFSLGQVEKDYFQHIVLSTISRKYAGELVFKGGTALQKMGYVERFSEDLDFTASSIFDLERTMNTCLEAISNYNFKASYDRVRGGPDSTGFRLRIEGPLFKGGKGLCTISLDISTRESVVIAPESREYSPIYPNVSPYILTTMDPREILGEKIRTLMTRKRPRDLYDASRLIERGFKIDKGLVGKKLAYYDITFDEGELMNRCLELKRGWEVELKQLLDTVPDHETCMALVKKALR